MFEKAFRESTSDAVRTLATGASLGGQYAEEVCALSGIPKNTPSSELKDEDIRKLWDCMKDLVARILEKPSPILYKDAEGEITDITPTELVIYKELERQEYPTLSSALDVLMDRLAETEEKNYVDPELEKLQRRIDKQTETIEEYRHDAEELRLKADAIYTNYAQINELLEVLKTQSARLTWDKLREGAMKIPFVHSIDPSKDTVKVKFDDMVIQLDYTKGIDANASDIYAQGKEIGDKSARAEEALKESVEAYNKKLKGITKAQMAKANRVAPTKQFWFERYKWFVTSEGRLVIAGKDAHTNDNIVRKHLKDTDVYAHADLHGAPSTILKDGQKASDSDLREACNFALAQSKGWVAALTDGSAYWVYPDQVSKTPEAGEFVPRGAFIIRGKRNYEHHLPIELAVGEILYQKERKVMCGPVDSVKAQSEKYFVIVPGRGKAGKTAALMAKELDVPEEEVSRILPPGDCEIKQKVWPEESPEE
jgi:predicted ribosome quality control (RQC) complex YloA/Tae2 family protein